MWWSRPTLSFGWCCLAAMASSVSQASRSSILMGRRTSCCARWGGRDAGGSSRWGRLMARTWTCRRCRSINPRIRQKCDCGQARPKRPTASQKALDAPYEQWVQWFGESCGICGKVPSEGQRRLYRDHDHATGKPRGLACFNCNRKLPRGVDVPWLLAAADYLQKAQSFPYSGSHE